MTAVDDTTKNESRTTTGVGPGDRLQAARIQKGLSIDDVASRMHLSASILQAIEENNFEEITAPIFVKGYLRAYARIVALDEDDMIQQYSDYYSEEDPPISSTSNMVPELSVTDARIKWTTYLVILVLAALLTVWWWNKGQNDEPTISLDTQNTAEGQDGQVVADTDARVIEAASEEVAETTDSTQESEQSTLSEEVVEDAVADTEIVDTETVDSEAEEEASEAATTQQAPVEVAAQQTQVEEASDDQGGTDSAAEAVTESAPAGRNTSGLIAPSGSDRLRISVNADTWADIKDSSGYQLVYDLLRADQTVELTGAAPFKVFLGNGHGVEIDYNDEEYDFSSRIRDDNTARLRIGG